MKKYKLIIALKIDLTFTKEEQKEFFRKQKYELMKIFAQKGFDIIRDANVSDNGIFSSTLSVKSVYDIEYIAEIFKEEVCFDYKNNKIMPLSTKKVLDETF